MVGTRYGPPDRAYGDEPDGDPCRKWAARCDRGAQKASQRDVDGRPDERSRLDTLPYLFYYIDAYPNAPLYL